MILSFLFFAFIAYLVFKLVVDFIIPVYKTTKQVKQKFRDMQEHVNGQRTTGKANTGSNGSASKPSKTPVGDYIDFEEVKDK
jgi:hypothetical protein